MSELIKFYVKNFLASRLIGKQIICSMKQGAENPVPDFWQTMISDGSLEFLKNMPERSTIKPDTVGWMGEFNPETHAFVYIVGVLTKPDTVVPEGFVYRDIPECNMAVGWIQGSEENGDLYMGAHDHVARAMKENGYEYDNSAGGFEMEYYSHDRFCTPNYMGEKLIVMDYYSPCKKLLSDDKSKTI